MTNRAEWIRIELLRAQDYDRGHAAGAQDAAERIRRYMAESCYINGRADTARSVAIGWLENAAQIAAEVASGIECPVCASPRAEQDRICSLCDCPQHVCEDDHCSVCGTWT